MNTLSLSFFDTLRYVKRLKEADVPEKQAEAQAEVLREVLEATVVEQSRVAQEASEHAVASLDTKTERAVVALETNTERAIAALDAKVVALETKTERAIAALDARLETEIALVRKDLALVDQRSQSRFNLLYWMFAGQIAILFALAVALAPAALKMYFGA